MTTQEELDMLLWDQDFESFGDFLLCLDLELDFLVWDLGGFETLGEFLNDQELEELKLPFNQSKTFGEMFMGMKKVWPLKGVIVEKGYICLKEADE